MRRLALVALLVLCMGITLPPITKKKKRLVAPNPHGATYLMFAPIVSTPTTNLFIFRYKTNATAAFGWALESSTDLTNWEVRIYPVISNDMWVFESKTNTKTFYRVRGKN